MDSGNSGSLQSSSGGDEEYDSRATVAATSTDSISAFLNHHQTLPNPSHPPFYSSIFDPLSNYNYDPRPPQPIHNPNPLLNLDPLIWSNKTLHQKSQPDQINPFFSQQPDSQPRNISLAAPACTPLPPLATSDQNPRPASSPSATSSSLAVRNPKKRARASRRAPTTVLTTDTSNFRAMVQEFTGIPSPPFAASHFPRSGLDLFGIRSSNNPNPNKSTFNSTTSDHPPPPLPPYLLRPFPQKLHPPPNASFQSDFLNQTLPSSSFLAGLKTHNSLLETPGPSSNNKSINNNLVDDHQFGLGIHGKARGSTMVASGVQGRGSANYDSHLVNVKTTMGYTTATTTATNTGSFQASRGLLQETMNGSGTRGEGMVESWICSTSD